MSAGTFRAYPILHVSYIFVLIQIPLLTTVYLPFVAADPSGSRDLVWAFGDFRIFCRLFVIILLIEFHRRVYKLWMEM